MKPHPQQKALLLRWTMYICIALSALSLGCQPQSKGFVLPEGDSITGKRTFVDLNCTRCHSVSDLAWSGDERYDDVHVKLGGEVTAIKTYGELVTSVINPSHKISQQHDTDQILTLADTMSKMERFRYNDIMTVQQLVDVVAFLQSEYELVPPENPYPYY